MSQFDKTSSLGNTASATRNTLESVSSQPPTVSQPSSYNSDDKMGLNKTFIYSLYGIIRLAIIISQFAGWISAAAVPKITNGQIYMPPEFTSTRDGYLFFSITGFLISIGLFVIFSFNINFISPFNRLPIVLFILASDIIWLITMFILAIVCAAREGSLRDPLFQYNYLINSGAFGAASCFGFVSSLFYGIDTSLFLMKTIRGEIDI